MTRGEAERRRVLSWAFRAALENEPVVTSLRKSNGDDKAADIMLAHLFHGGFTLERRRKKKKGKH